MNDWRTPEARSNELLDGTLALGQWSLADDVITLERPEAEVLEALLVP